MTRRAPGPRPPPRGGPADPRPTSRRTQVLAALLALPLALAPRPAHASDELGPRARRLAGPLLDEGERAALTWRPVPLYYPVATEPVGGRAWGVPPVLRDLTAAPLGTSPELPIPRTLGPVVVGPRRAALVRAASLAVLRLRVAAEGDAPPPRPELRRISGEPGASFSALVESGHEVSPGTWLIEQPPGGPGYWLIRAASPARVWVEAAEERTGDLIWEHASAALLAWIDEGGPLPPLPAVADEEALRLALLADAEIAAELRRREPEDRELQRAAAAWRAAAALHHLTLQRDLQRAAFALESAPRPLERTEELLPAGAQDLPWRRSRGTDTWDLRLEGPGLLVVRARLVGPGQPAALEVTSEGRRLAQVRLAPHRTEEPLPGLGAAPVSGPADSGPGERPEADPAARPPEVDEPTSAEPASRTAPARERPEPASSSPPSARERPEPEGSPPGRIYQGPESPTPSARPTPTAPDPSAARPTPTAPDPSAARPSPVPRDTSLPARAADLPSPVPRATTLPAPSADLPPPAPCLAPTPAPPPRVPVAARGAGDELLAGPFIPASDDDLAARLERALGAPIGPRGELRVALAPGWHTYTLRFAGHDGVLQVRSARDNERLAAALRGDHLAAELRRARRALARSESPRAAVLAALLDPLEGVPPRRTPPVSESPILNLALSLLRAQQTGLDPAARRDLARTIARRANQVGEGPLTWRARAAALDLLADLREPALARALAGPRPAEAPAAVLAQVAQHIEGPPLALRSPAVALLERARRLRPLDLALRSVFRERWRSGTRWAALRADEDAGEPWTWIEPLPPGPGRGATTSSLWTLRPGARVGVRAAPSAHDPDRAALLRLYVRAAAPAAPIALHVDAERWHTRALRPLEQLRVALPPGVHNLQLRTPGEGAQVWSSLPPEPAAPPDARLLRMWPLAPGGEVRFVLPGGDAPAYARVELRVIAAELPARVQVQVGSDRGPARDVDLELGAEDQGVLPVDAPEGAGRRATLVVPIEPEARLLRVRLAASAPRVAVAAQIRATQADPGLSREVAAEPAAPRPADDRAHAALAELSRALLAAPDDPELRLRRAGLLLDLGQVGYAFVDWTHVAARGVPNALLPAALDFAARLETLGAPSHLDVSATGPLLVEPALAAVVGDEPARLDPHVPAIAAAWARGPAAGLAALRPAPGADAPKDTSRTPALGSRPGVARPEGPVPDATSSGAAPRDASRAPARPEGPVPDATSPGAAPRDASRAPARPEGPVPDATSSGAAAEDTPGAPGPDLRARPDLAGPDLAAAALRAGWLDELGRASEAAALWAQIGGRAAAVPADLAAARSFLAALDGTPPAADGAGLAYGLAQGLTRTIRTPAVRRLETLAAARSRWSRISSSERDAGSEGLEVPRASALPSPSAAVREALLAPPWPHHDATLLRPGGATVLSLRRDDPGPLAVDLWCQALRPDLGDGAPARVRVRLDEVELHHGPVPEATSQTFETAALPPGAHRVEVELDPTSAAHLCSARLRGATDAADALASRRPTRWHLARPQRPLEVVALGPTTLALEIRADLRSGAAGAVLDVARGDGPYVRRDALDLPQAPDPAVAPERSRTLSPGLAATRVFTIAEPGPHRIRVTPDRGAALVRVHQRVDGSDSAEVPPAPVRRIDLAELVDELGPLSIPALALAREAPLAPPVQRFGTTRADLRLGTDDLEDSDDLTPRLTGLVGLGYARELVARRLWLALGPELRPREATPLAGGGELALQALFPRLGLRARAGLGALAQAHDDGRAWALRAFLRLDRPTWIAPRLQLLPRLDLLGRVQSLHAADMALGTVHPRIYQRYLEDHPFVLRPGLDLRYQPWQDARLIGGVELAPNSDFRGLDYASAQLGLYGVLALPSRLVPEFWLEEELSLRLRDPDRPQTYLRNRLRAGLGLGVWAGRAARVVVGAADTLYAAAPFPLRNVLELWLRVDLVLGRGLRDYGPLDLTFRAVREHRLWHPRP